MMKVQILGPGCPKCKLLAENVERALRDNGIQADVEKVTSIQEIMKFGVMMTPALAVNGKVVSSGKVLSPQEIGRLLTPYQGEDQG